MLSIFNLHFNQQIHFLRDKLYEVESTIQAGLGRYTWQTLNIKTFCETCERLLKNLSAIVTQIGMIAKDISSTVSDLELFILFGKTDFENKNAGFGYKAPIILKTSKISEKTDHLDLDEVLTKNELATVSGLKKSVRITERDINIRPCLEYFRNLEIERNESTALLQKLYESIGPTMIKLESLILGTFTGESDKMSYYYTYWEKEMFSTLVRFTTKNLQKFSETLMQESVMFEVDAILAAPEITMKPSSNEIYNIMVHCVKDFLER